MPVLPEVPPRTHPESVHVVQSRQRYVVPPVHPVVQTFQLVELGKPRGTERVDPQRATAAQAGVSVRRRHPGDLLRLCEKFGGERLGPVGVIRAVRVGCRDSRHRAVDPGRRVDHHEPLRALTLGPPRDGTNRGDELRRSAGAANLRRAHRADARMYRLGCTRGGHALLAPFAAVARYGRRRALHRGTRPARGSIHGRRGESLGTSAPLRNGFGFSHPRAQSVLARLALLPGFPNLRDAHVVPAQHRVVVPGRTEQQHGRGGVVPTDGFERVDRNLRVPGLGLHVKSDGKITHRRRVHRYLRGHRRLDDHDVLAGVRAGPPIAPLGPPLAPLLGQFAILAPEVPRGPRARVTKVKRRRRLHPLHVVLLLGRVEAQHRPVLVGPQER